MDYEKMYKNALSHAKQAYGTGAYDDSTLEAIFPELAESEDERIRRELISQVEKSRHHPADKARWISYLEKQKENPKSSDSIPSDCTLDAKCEDRWHKVADSMPDNPREVLCKDEAGNYFIGRYYVGEGWEISNYDDEDKPHHLNPPVSKWIDFPLEKQKESLHIPETCKENADSFTDDIIEVRSFQKGIKEGRRLEKKELDQMIVVSPEVWDKAISDAFENGKKEGEKQKEQKPSSRFNPGDWVVYDGPLGHAILQVKDVVGGRYSFVDNDSTLLVEDSDKFLRPLTPKDMEKPAEWSDENYDIISNISNQVYKAIRRTLASLAVYDEDEKLLESKEATLSYYSQQCAEAILKFLRPSWKPSKEQMEVLLSTQDMVRASGYRQNAKVLASLYEQLKKL